MSKDILDLEQSLASDPTNLAAFTALEEGYVKGKRWQDLVRLYEGQEEVQREDPKFWAKAIGKLEELRGELEELPERAEVNIQIGKIWEHKFERLAQALVHYQRAFKVWPYKTEALALARSIYVRQKNWKLVLRLFELELQVEKETGAQASLHFEKAMVLSREFDDVPGAVEVLRKAVELDPSNAEVRGLLASLTEEKPDWVAEVQGLREGLKDTANGPGAAALHVSIARLLSVNDPGGEEVERELKAALLQVPHHSEATDLLAGLYRRQQRWEDLAGVLKAVASETTVRKEEARAALIELASIHREHFDNEEAAAATFERLLALDPAHPAALRFATEFYERQERWDSLVELYNNALRMKRSSPEELDLRLELGAILWKKVEDLAAAEKHYRRVRLSDSKRPEMLEFYRHFFKGKGDWKKYYSTLATLRQVTGDEEDRLEISYEMARVASEEMKSPEKAIDVWKQVLKSDKTNEVARQSLHDLYIAAKKWNALLEHYKENVALLSADESEQSRARQVALSLKMVEIYRDKLRLDPLVINTYNAILQIDPENTQAIDALAERYEKSKRWNDLINILQRKAEVIGDNPEETLPLLHRIAELWQKRLGKIAQAIPALEQILELDATEIKAISSLKKIYNKRQKWDELLVVLEREAALIEPGKELAVHLSDMARVARRRLSNPDLARELQERVCAALESEGGEVADVSLFCEALGELEQIYADQGNDVALAKVLERRRRVTQGGDELELMERLAELSYDRLDDPERALTLWNEILTLDAGNKTALEKLQTHLFKNQDWEALEQLFGHRGEHARLFDVLDNGASIVDTDAEKVELFRRMARIAMDQLKDSEKVMLSLESILDLEQDNVEVARELLPFYEEAGEASKEIKANIILLENDGGDVFEVSRKISLLYETALEDLPSAFEWANRALRIRPQDGDLRLHIESLARSADRLAELVASYREVAQDVDEEEVRLALYRSVARTTNVDLEWFDDAVDYYERVLIAQPGDEECVDALLILYRQLARWQDLFDIMEKKATVLQAGGDVVAFVGLRFKMAELLQGSLERPDAAIEVYETILEAAPQNLDAVRGLRVLHDIDENWMGVATCLERELELLESGGEGASSAKLRLDLGQHYEHRLQEPNKAIEWYASLLSGEGASERMPAISALEGLLGEEGEVEMERRVRVATILEPVHRQDENHSGLTTMLEIRLGAMDDGGSKAEVLGELARLYEHKCEDNAGAFDALRRLLLVTPSDDGVWNEFERLGGLTRSWDEVAEIYSGFTPRFDELDAPLWRFELLRRLARVYEQELDNDDFARDAYEVLLGRDDGDQLTIESLEKVYTRLEANPELVALLVRKAELGQDPAQRREVLLQVATLQEEELEAPLDAVETYRQVLVDHPEDAVVIGHLERLFEEQSCWEDLVELLQRKVGLADGADVLSVKHQLAVVLEEQLQDLGGAIEVYREIVAADATHEALGALERINADLHELGGDVDQRRAVDETLEPVYEQAQDWVTLAGLLEARLSYLDSDDEIQELYLRVARLQRDQLADPVASFEHFKTAVSMNFADAGLRTEFEALAGQIGAHSDLVELYETELSENEASSDPALRRVVLQCLATLHEDELNDRDSAIDSYRLMLDLDAEDDGALTSLERLYGLQSMWSELVEVCLVRAGVAEGEAKVELLRKVGRLHRGPLEDAHSAIETQKRVLELTPRDGGALEQLESLYTEGEHWRELVYVLNEQVEAAEAVDAKRALLFRVAQLHEGELSEPHEAIETYVKVLELSPEDSETLDHLDRLYSEHEHWIELGAVLERKLCLAEESAEKDEIQFRIGELQQHRLFNLDDAIETYRTILARSQDAPEPRAALVSLLDDSGLRFAASKVLEPIFRSEGRNNGLVSLLELQLEDTHDDAPRLALLDDIARIHEEELGDLSSAFGAVRRAYLIDPMAPARVNVLERLAEETSEWKSLVTEAYEVALPEINEGREVLRVHLAVAEIYRDRLEDAIGAEASFRNALIQEPECLEAMEALEVILEGQERWEDLLDVLGSKYDTLAQSDAAAAVEVLFRAAEVHDGILGNASDAIDTYRRILDLLVDLEDAEGSNGKALSQIKGLYRREERWGDLTSLLIRQIDLGQSEGAKVELRTELADVYRSETGQYRPAVDVYREILGSDPEHEASIESLEGFFRDAVETVYVASILEPIYRRRESWSSLVEVLRALEHEQFEGPDREAVLIQVARITEERVGDEEGALLAYQRLAEENPSLEGAWDQVERLAGGLDRWSDAEQFYRLTLEENLKVTDDLRLPMLLRRARILDDHVDDVEEAIAVYREVLLFSDTNEVALDALERLFTRSEAWTELVELYRQSAELTDDVARSKRLYYKIATLHEEVVGDVEGAVEAYRCVCEVDPQEREAVRGLERLYQRQEMWRELTDLYRREAEATADEDTALGLKHQLAGILCNELDEVAEAITIYRDILSSRSSWGPTRRSLETLLREVADEDLRLQIAVILEPLYDEEREWEKLLHIHEVQLGVVRDPGGRVTILRESARLMETYQDDDNEAFLAYARAFSADVEDRDLQKDLERMAAKVEGWGQLIEIYLGSIGRCQDVQRVAQLLHRAATLYLEKLKDNASAITVYKQILDLSDEDRRAISQLEDLYTRSAQHEKLVQVLIRRADLERDVLEKKELYYRIASLWENSIGRNDEAIVAYRQIMDLDEEDLAAIESLERLFRRSASWDQLITIFQVKVDIVEETAEKIEIHKEMAEVYEHSLMEIDEAIGTFLTIRDLDPQNLDAVRALTRLYLGEQRWNDLLDTLDVERTLVGDDLGAANAIEFRMGQLLEEELDQPVRAIGMYRQILERDAEHGPAIEALEALMEETRCRRGAAEVLQPLYERTRQWSKLIDALEAIFNETDEAEDRRQLLERIARIQEERLDNAPMAFITYSRAFREAPAEANPRESLERLANEMANYEELVAIYEESLEDLYDFDLVMALSLRLGEVYSVEMGDHESAVVHYRKVLSIEEYHPEALKALDSLFEAMEHWQDLAGILERKLHTCDDDARSDLKFRLANIEDVHFNQYEQAIGHYKDVLEMTPNHEGAVEALERICLDRTFRLEIVDLLEVHYTGRKEWSKLVSLLRLKLEMVDFSSDRAELLRQAAKISEEQLGDPSTALGIYSEALLADPEDGRARPDVERLAAQCEEWSEAVALYRSLAPQLGDPSERLDVLLKLAGWQSENLGEHNEAERSYREVLSLDETNAQALDALEAIYLLQRRFTSLYEVYALKVELIYEDEARKALFMKMADIAVNQLGEPEKAIEAWKKLRASDESDTDALEALEGLYAEDGQWPELIEVLETRVDLSDETAARVALRLQIAQVCREHLGSLDEAVNAYRGVLDLEVGNLAAVEALEELYSGQQDWLSLQEIMGQHLTFAQSDDEKIRLNLRLAQLTEERFEDLPGAIEHHQQILMVDAGHSGSIENLERLYTSCERWVDLQELYEARLERCEDDSEALTLHVAISQLATDHLGDVEMAKEHLHMVLKSEPDNIGALDVIGKLLQGDGEWDKAMGVLERQISLTSDTNQLSVLHHRRGLIHMDHLDSIGQAQGAFEQALKTDTGNAQALASLKEVYRSTENWEGVLALYRLEGQQQTQDDAKVSLYLEMAQVAKERLGDEATAVEALEKAYAASDGSIEVAERLLQAYVDVERWDRAEPILDGIIESLRQRRKFKMLHKFHHLRGQIAEKKGDRERALESFKAAHDIDATYVPNLLSLGKLYVLVESWDDALKIFQTLLLHQLKIKSPQDKLDVYYNLGRVRMVKGDERRAKDMFKRALGVERTHAPSLAALEELG